MHVKSQAKSLRKAQKDLLNLIVCFKDALKNFERKKKLIRNETLITLAQNRENVKTRMTEENQKKATKNLGIFKFTKTGWHILGTC